MVSAVFKTDLNPSTETTSGGDLRGSGYASLNASMFPSHIQQPNALHPSNH